MGDVYEQLGIENPFGDPLKPMWAVAVNGQFLDPAVEVRDPQSLTPDEEEMLATYRRTRDLTDLRFKPGCKPNLFRIDKLSRKAAMYLEAQSLAFRASTAFLWCVHHVQLAEGGSLTLSDKQLTKQAGGTVAPKDEDAWIELVGDRFGNATLAEMGALAVLRASLPAGARGPFC